MPGKDINHGLSEIIIGKHEKNFIQFKKKAQNIAWEILEGYEQLIWC